MAWRKTMLQLKFHARSRNARSGAREGYVRDDGLIAVPPKAGGKLKAWLRKMGIEP